MTNLGSGELQPEDENGFENKVEREIVENHAEGKGLDEGEGLARKGNN